MFYPICNEKIGNLLLYLAQKIPQLHLTKLLKIIYIIDETAVREIGVPVTWLDYQVWKLGPVPKNIYDELRNNKKIICQNDTFSLSKFIKIQNTPNPKNPQKDCFAILPNAVFDDGEFNDYEMELIDKTINTYKFLSSEQIINELHEQGTLWEKMVNSKELERVFELEGSRSNHTIDFTDLLQEDTFKSMAYKAAYEALSFQEELDFQQELT